jgi:hypothetical protein
MIKSIFGKQQKVEQSSSRLPLIEGLESRQLLSAAPPLVSLSPVSPGKILAGSKPGTEVVTIRNLTAATETVPVTVTVAPSLDGSTADGTYTATVTETLTIKKHGSAKVKVPFVPPITLTAGKYYTLVTANVGGTAFSGVAPKTYTLTLPPLPTTTPSLIGHYVGLITATSSQSTGFFGGGTSTTVHQLSFIWETNAQTLTSLSGLFAVGDQQVDDGTMQGYELTNGVLHYTLASPDINYTMDAKVSANGQTITGKFKGVLVNNLFKTIGGSFKLTVSDT